jgi:hypothetical protein
MLDKGAGETLAHLRLKRSGEIDACHLVSSVG